jgi:hypothetical protein
VYWLYASFKFKEEIKSEIRQEYQARTTADKAEDTFWNEFYQDNEDLKEHKLIVDAIIQRDVDELKPKPIAQIKKDVADRAREYLIKLNPQQKAESVHTETPSSTVIDKQEKPVEEKVVTLSDQLRQKKESRYKARINFKQVR